jgi:hypothetical protein
MGTDLYILIVPHEGTVDPEISGSPAYLFFGIINKLYGIEIHLRGSDFIRTVYSDYFPVFK